eukprot:TRINITY_DN35727_c0_g1_i1.p1 TRINITY_DN35727_c0_g1~~TRINITY_DN35727_c0_g1_i1.p1  ORF type:complete len:243 (+),score=10.44 TRINITY_DN35727_c0_g1_i1:39-767(+)
MSRGAGLFSEQVSSAPRMGTAKRFSYSKSPRDTTPGPGAYSEVKSTFSQKGARISTAKRFNYDSTANRRSVSSHGRLETVSSVPGPAAYETNKTTLSPSGGTVARARRDFGWRGAESPGPMAYNTNSSTLKATPSTFGTAKRSRSSRGYDTPGPCAYNTDRPSTTGSGKPATFGRSKRTTAFGKDAPGPAMYDSCKSTLNSKGGTIGRSSRRPTSANSPNYSPGPGDYNPNYVAESRIRKTH